jgi:hypothetical protein
MTPRKAIDGQGRAEGARYPSLGRTGSPARHRGPQRTCSLGWELARWGRKPQDSPSKYPPRAEGPR